MIVDIYGEKLHDIFLENSNLNKAHSALQKDLTSKEQELQLKADQVENLNLELKTVIRESEEHIEAMKIEYTRTVETYEEEVARYKEKALTDLQLADYKEIKSDLQELKQSKEESDQKMINLECNIKQLQEEKAALESKSNEVKDSYQSLLKQDQTVNTRIADMENSIKLHKEMLEEKEDAITNLTNEIERLNGVVNTLTDENKTLQNKAPEVDNSKVEELEKEVERLERRKDNLSEENDELREIIAKDQITLKDLKEFKVNALSKNSDEMLQSSESEKAALNSEISDLKEKMKLSEEKLHIQTKEAEEAASTSTDQISQLTREIESLKIQTQKYEEDSKNTHKEQEKLQSDLMNKNKELEIEITNLKADLADKEADILKSKKDAKDSEDNFDNRNKDLLSEINLLKLDVTTKQSIIDKLNEESRLNQSEIEGRNEKLESEISLLKFSLEEQQKLSQSFQEETKSRELEGITLISQLKSEIESLKKQIENEKLTVNKMGQEAKAAESIFVKMKSEFEVELSTLTSEVEKQKTIVSQLSQESKDLQESSLNKNKEQESKILELNTKISEQKTELLLLKGKSENAEVENSTLQSVISQLKDSIEEQQKSSENQLKESEAKEKKMSEEIAKLNREVVSLNCTIDDQKQEIESKGDQVAKAESLLTNENKQLKSEITSLKISLEDQQKTMSDKVKQESAEAKSTLTKVNNTLLAEIVTLKSQLEEYQKASEKQILLTNSTEEKLRELTIQLDNKSKEIDNYLIEISEHNHNINSKEQELATITAEKDNLAEELAKMKNDNEKEKEKEFEEIIDIETRGRSVTVSSQITTSFDQYAFTREILIDFIFSSYILANSINLHEITEILIKDFGTYLNSIFLQNSDYHLSFSLMHEFIENIFFKIYDIAMINKLDLVKSDTRRNSNMFILDQSDITPELVNKIAGEAFHRNIITLVSSINKQTTTVDDIVTSLFNRYEKVFDFGGLSLQEYYNKEIKHIITDKIEKYKQSILNDMKSLVELAASNIHGGKITNKGREIYDYRSFYLGYMGKETKSNHPLSIKQSIMVPESINNLLYNLKSHGKFLLNIHLSGNYDNKGNHGIEKVCLTILIYCPNIIKFSLTDSNSLSHDQLLEIIKIIEYSKHLKYLDLSNNNLGDSGVKVLCESLKTNKSIIAIIINKNEISSNGGFYLAEALMKNPNIEELSVSTNTINEGGFSSMISVLINNNRSLKHLDISSNKLVLEDFISVADLISKSTEIQSLNLSNNVLDSKSANYLSTALRNTINLTSLYLNMVQLNEESAALLMKDLSETRVSEIYFDVNPLGEIGAVLLANVLKANNHIKIISAKKCNLSPMAMICFAKSLAQKDVLEQLHLEDNTFDEMSLAVFMKNLESKKVKVYLTADSLTPKAKELLSKSVNFILV